MANYTNLLNNLYGKVNIESIATKTFQDIVDSKNAVLSILSHTGIAGFKFHIPDREQITYNSQITTHYLENNEPAQDHIANEPVRITLQGYQGEYFYPVQKFEALAAAVIPTMSLIPEFMPQISAITKQVKTAKLNYELKNQIKDLYSANTSSPYGQAVYDYINKGSITDSITRLKSVYQNNFNSVDLFALFQNLYKFKSAQTRAFYFLEALWKSKMVFSVETSWKRFDNMAITNLTPTRDKNLDITDFKVSLQQINRTYSRTITVNSAGRTSIQKSEVADKGTDKGVPVI